MNSKQFSPKIWGLFQRKIQWTLTLKGWSFFLFIVIVGGLWIISQIHPFLAYNAPIEAEFLVVEGWIPDYAIEEAVTQFNQGNYQKIITTGLPLERGSYLSEYNNFAQLAAETCLALGVDAQKIVPVSAPITMRDRTEESAIAFRQWLFTSETSIKSINVLSHDTHTRRSWLLFKKVLSPDIKVGAISVPPKNYNPKFWWKFSEGTRSIISEMIAYFYIKIFAF